MTKDDEETTGDARSGVAGERRWESPALRWDDPDAVHLGYGSDGLEIPEADVTCAGCRRLIRNGWTDEIRNAVAPLEPCVEVDCGDPAIEALQQRRDSELAAQIDALADSIEHAAGLNLNTVAHPPLLAGRPVVPVADLQESPADTETVMRKATGEAHWESTTPMLAKRDQALRRFAESMAKAELGHGDPFVGVDRGDGLETVVTGRVVGNTLYVDGVGQWRLTPQQQELVQTHDDVSLDTWEAPEVHTLGGQMVSTAGTHPTHWDGFRGGPDDERRLGHVQLAYVARGEEATTGNWALVDCGRCLKVGRERGLR